MRKLSELYQVVLDNYDSLQEVGICLAIARIADNRIISNPEYFFVYKHFKYGDHKFPMNKRWAFWFKSTEERIAYLEYLIKLCKEQDI